MRVKYSHNNSGGYWWLDDEDWYALETAGWKVNWVKDEEWKNGKNERFLGALATSASKENITLEDAVEEWERVTGQSSTDAGCPCCGQPHYFTEETDDGSYVSSGPNIRYEASW
jgi:hypothetical protein